MMEARERAVEALQALATNGDRLAVLSEFCWGCGGHDPDGEHDGENCRRLEEVDAVLSCSRCGASDVRWVFSDSSGCAVCAEKPDGWRAS